MSHRDFTRGSLASHVAGFGFPLWLGMAAHVSFNLINLVMIGRVSTAAVAAVHVGSILNFIPMVLGNGVTVSAVAIVSQRLGAGQIAEARAAMNRSHLLMLVLGVVFSVLGYVTAGPAVRFQWAEGVVETQAVRYLEILSAGTLTMFLLLQVCTVLRVLGRAGLSVAILVGSNVLNLLLDILLIYGYQPWHIPALGVEGTAWATLIARGVGGGAGLWIIAHPKLSLSLGWPPRVPGNRDYRQLLTLGLPQSLQMLVRVLAVIYVTRVASSLGGRDAQAALSVGVRLDSLLLFGAGGWAGAATAIVGQCLGAGQRVRAQVAARWAGIWSAVSAAVVALMLAIWAEPILEVFVPHALGNTDPGYLQYLEHGTRYLAIAVWAHPFGCVCVALTGAFNGASVTVPPLVVDAVGFLGLLIPTVSYLGEYHPELGLPALWWSLVAANAVLMAAYLWLLERKRWSGPPTAAAPLASASA